MRPFFRALYELARAAWHGRLDAAFVEMGLAIEQQSLEAGDFDEARAIWRWAPVAWGRRHYVERLRRRGCSEVTIEAELDELRARVRRDLAEAERLRLRGWRP